MIKRAFIPVIAIASVIGLSLSSCDVIEEFLSQGDAVDGLKEALYVGADTAVTQGLKMLG